MTQSMLQLRAWVAQFVGESCDNWRWSKAHLEGGCVRIPWAHAQTPGKYMRDGWGRGCVPTSRHFLTAITHYGRIPESGDQHVDSTMVKDGGCYTPGIYVRILPEQYVKVNLALEILGGGWRESILLVF
jgi:hypothetical protein